MAGLHPLVQDGDRAAVQRDRLVAPAAFGEQDGEVVQRRGQIGVLVSEQRFEQGDPAPVERFGFVVPAEPVPQRGELAEVERDLVVGGAEGALEDRQRRRALRGGAPGGRSGGARPWVAHSQHARARTLLALGDRAAARALAASARATARELGMTALASDIDAGEPLF